VQDFNRAGENAFMARVSYDFARLGLEGVAAYALFVHGWGRIDPSTKEPVANENEFDADIQWRPQWKSLKGLWFRVRYANVRQYEGPKNTINDFRTIVNYDLPLL
jgi:outer membrane porin, OprD family